MWDSGAKNSFSHMKTEQLKKSASRLVQLI
jgi:hypothetical protein